MDGLEKLATLAAWVLTQHDGAVCAPGNIEDAALWEKCVSLGIFEEVERDKPCGDTCVCAELSEPSFRCLQFHRDIVLALIALDGYEPSTAPTPLTYGTRVRIADRAPKYAGQTGTVIREMQAYIGNVPEGIWLVDLDAGPRQREISEYFTGDLLTVIYGEPA